VVKKYKYKYKYKIKTYNAPYVTRVIRRRGDESIPVSTQYQTVTDKLADGQTEFHVSIAPQIADAR